MKKLFLFLLAFGFMFGLAACGTRDDDVEKTKIALITDYGDIDDESFNQGTWEGILAYAEQHGMEIEYFRPAEVSDADYIDSIDLAVELGFGIIVTPGFLFQRAIYESQNTHPDVKFILLDAQPRDATGNFVVGPNTLSIFYDEHESGFLAGYAAVMEGFTNLGFMGGIAVPAVVRFGIGFIAGAYYAALQEEVELVFPNNRYDYLGTFNAGPGVETQAAGWFDDGTEVIFAAAGGAGLSVMSAATDKDAWMIGVDVDQSGLSERVMTSAMKALAASVQLALDSYYIDEDFAGGETWYLGAANDGVALPFETSRFETFTEAQYNEIFALLADGTIEVPATYAELVAFFEDLDILDLLLIEQDTVSPPPSG
ncbi:MAG: BMP family ABC transporter substrate-binding protein [Acholeplasmatales bacterium]|nr:MAG: BMP family ABC transporter substrate-binding protein [Acholeplasmatales bacterium]